MKRKEKLIGLFMVLFAMISVNAWGFDHSTHYGKVTVTANGNGSVYIGTTNDATSGKTVETWNCERNGDNDTKTYYLFAKAEDGYEFTGWSGDGTSTNNPYEISATASSTNSGSPTTKNYTANFKKIETYFTKGQAVIYGNEGGSVYVSKVSGNFEGATSSATNYQVTTTPSADTYYFKAEAEEGYVFDAWYTNAECTQGRNVNSEITATVTSESTDQNSPTTVTRYAKFLKLETYYVNAKAVAKEGGLVYVNNVAGNNNSTYEPAQVSNNSQDNVTSYSTAIYFRAKPVDGYVFEGWYTDEQCTQKTNKSQNFQETVTGTTENTTHVTYYANFIYSTYYSKVTANGSADGNVFVSAKTVVDEPNYAQSSNDEIKEQAEPNPTHTYYLYAQANDGKAFQGWRYNNTIVSYDNPLKVEITNPSTNSTATSRTYTAVFGEPSSNWTWGEAPAAGQYYIYSPTNNVYIKATSTVTAERDDATLFTLSGSSNFTIAYDDNDSTKYVYESAGNQSWGTTNTRKWNASKQNGGYYISHSDPDKNVLPPTRYIQVSATAINYPKENFNGNDRLLIFISPAEIPAEAAYTTAWNSANALTAEQKNNLSSEASAQLTEYLTKPTDITNAAEVTAILNALCKAAEGDTRSTASGKYGTICLPYAFTATGATVYSVTGYNQGVSTLKLSEVTKPEAGVPYIYETTADEQSFDMSEGKCVADPVDDDYLVGLISNVRVPNGAYVLQTQNGKQAFYKLNKENGANGQAYHCYLKADNIVISNDAKALYLGAEEETAIDAISALTSGDVQSIYTANGAKVGSLQKGLNIVKMADGSVKKIMIK